MEAGDSHGGCSVHLVTAELDDGPILGQTPVAILPGDTAESLAARVLIAEHQLYSRVLATMCPRQLRSRLAGRSKCANARWRCPKRTRSSHGMPCFGIIKGKKFAYVSHDHHGDGKTALLVKISGAGRTGDADRTDEDRYYRPAYFGDGWIGIRLDLGDTDWDHIEGRSRLPLDHQQVGCA
jgi:phosphoribosylglycinamide formyltransferase-1